MAVRVLLVDDQDLFRQGLALLLPLQPGIEVVGDVASGPAGIELATAIGPDVVLLDIDQRRGSGIVTCAALRAALPDAGLVALTAAVDEGGVYATMDAGARGYLLKDSSIEEVADAVHAVAQGQSVISPAVAARLGAETMTSVSAERLPAIQLTARELEVLRLVALGRDNREIGVLLGISVNTVKNHLRNILTAFGVHSRMEAVVRAAGAGLVDLG